MEDDYRHGVWTPWAAVLCMECHGPICRGVEFPEYDELCRSRPAPFRHEGSTHCEKCSNLIVVRDDVAACSELRYRLRSMGIEAYLEQTGGMCVGVTVPVAALDAHDLLITADEEEDDQWYVGLYNSDGKPVVDLSRRHADIPTFDEVPDDNIVPYMLRFGRRL